ncbi:hypothetical protein MJQ72_35585 [Amycolatopsis sp. EV170708-02-1]|nr:hypothetical protein MJQ72_35585 [Amycolatopsis sp. EV170708-02-1]
MEPLPAEIGRAPAHRRGDREGDEQFQPDDARGVPGEPAAGERDQQREDTERVVIEEKVGQAVDDAGGETEHREHDVTPA